MREKDLILSIPLTPSEKRNSNVVQLIVTAERPRLWLMTVQRHINKYTALQKHAEKSSPLPLPFPDPDLPPHKIIFNMQRSTE